MSTAKKKTGCGPEDWPGVSPFPILFAQGAAAVNFGPQVCKIHFVDAPTSDDTPVTVAEIVLPTSGFLDLLARSIHMLQSEGVIDNMEAAQKKDMLVLRKFREAVEKK